MVPPRGSRLILTAGSNIAFRGVPGKKRQFSIQSVPADVVRLSAKLETGALSPGTSADISPHFSEARGLAQRPALELRQHANESGTYMMSPGRNGQTRASNLV